MGIRIIIRRSSYLTLTRPTDLTLSLTTPLTLDKQPTNPKPLALPARGTHNPHHPSSPLTSLPHLPEPMVSTPLLTHWLDHAVQTTHLSVPSPPPFLPNPHTPSPLHPLFCPKNLGESSPLPSSLSSSPCSLLSPTTHPNTQEHTLESPDPAVHRAAQEEEEKVQYPSGSRRVPRRYAPSLLSLFVPLDSPSLDLTCARLRFV